MKRYGWVIGLRSEKIDEYKRLHAAAWPGVLQMIKECHIQNYSIYLRSYRTGTTTCSVTWNTSAAISPQTWPRWRRTGDAALVGGL